MLKNNLSILSKIQLFLMALCIPFLLGQTDCQINQSLVDSMTKIAINFKPSTPGGKIYISQLSFMDTDSKTIMVKTEEAKLINEAVFDGIKRAQKINTSIVLDDPAHMLKNNDANVSKLTAIIYDKNKTPGERINKIIKDIMEPVTLDVVVTGQYTDRGDPDPIILKPFLIVKKDKKILTRALKFERKEYICPDPNNKSQKALCSTSHEEIAKAIKDLLDAL